MLIQEFIPVIYLAYKFKFDIEETTLNIRNIRGFYRIYKMKIFSYLFICLKACGI